MKYEWLETGWKVDEQKLCGEVLESRLHLLLTTDSVMPYKVKPPQLYNEHALVRYFCLSCCSALMKLLYISTVLALIFDRHFISQISIFQAIFAGFYLHKFIF